MMQMKNSYRQRLLFYFIAGGMLPVLVLSVCVLYSTNYMMRDTLIEKSGNEVRMASEDIDKLAHTYRFILNSLCNEADIQALLAGKRGNLREIYSKHYLISSGHTARSQIHVIDTEGNIRLSTGFINDDYKMPEKRDWGILRKAASHEDVVVNSSDKSKAYNRTMAFSLARAVRVDDKIVGYVIADIYRSAIVDLIQDRVGSSSRYFTVVDPYDYVMVNILQAGKEGFSSLPAPWRDELEKRGDGFFYDVDDQKEKQLVVYAVSPETGFKVIQSVSPTVVNATFELIKSIVAGACFVSLLLILLIAFGMTKNLWEPIQNLTLAMRRVWQNDFSIRVEIKGKDEISELGGTFNQMIDHIQLLIQHVEEKQKTLRIAQVKSLQAQVKPHFIYNTLDLIKWSAKMNDMEGVVMLSVRLGKLLRMTISSEKEYVRVAEEIKMLEYYIAIQQRRFNNRMEVVFDIDPSIEAYVIPKLILQPIVENAITHGLEEKKTDGYLLIRGRQENGYLRFEIQDNGCGIPAERLEQLVDQEEHIGIRNVDLRARINGDENCGLTIDSAEQEGTVVNIILAVREEVPVV